MSRKKVTLQQIVTYSVDTKIPVAKLSLILISILQVLFVANSNKNLSLVLTFGFFWR